MARDSENVSAGAQLKRPPLNQRESDSHSDTTNTSGAPSQHRAKHIYQRPHHVGRVHARVPSSKAVHKHAGHALKPNRRPTSPTDLDSLQPPGSHRRSISEVKLPSRSSATHLPKSASHSSLKRNRSHVEVGKRTRSSDKLKRTSSGTGIHSTKLSKTQVHFDLGSEDPEDEWVDASGSNSPYLSRKGSLNSSAQSSLPPGDTGRGLARPETPTEPTPPQARTPISPERERLHHKQYLTSRLLQRTPSHGAPPTMTAESAHAGIPQMTPSPNSPDRAVSPLPGRGRDKLTSRFVDTLGPARASQGSFYRPPEDAPHAPDESPHRPASASSLSKEMVETDSSTERENSALVPGPSRRSAGPPAETSRIQQKLNLQRASSVLELGQGVAGAGGVVGAGPLIGVGGPGFDGGRSRDPRVARLLERTGMEYLVVRRHQVPVTRSLNRLGLLPSVSKTRGVAQASTFSISSKKTPALPGRHSRNVSMPDDQPAAASRRTGANPSAESDERVGGNSPVGDDDDETTALLRNLWEKSMDLSASAD
ncbi:hypothetical protein DCS_07154 [Drechmeria coniospora]|uniref:Uncharacterized protein n=1 Tax=Drechmeria coniospora TaxID=98403 RepID=A0A151GDL1_DRECN|nr:hypothetical protein DCS_07154 [Drechmeria coniospora]KYK55192.1 hypothetical protein DCS_07154 [Drechmeria coniospora]ODA82184.1 hypothetical protein RJ55_00690 [Drechmeria coniospora]